MPKRWAEALCALVEDPARRRRMGRRGRRIVENEFSLEGVIAGTLADYGKVAAVQ
jgi:glycosyltransferase involved in cell wall biosynthesis